MSINLYFTKLSPPSRAVLMTFKQLNIPVTIRTVDLKNGEHLTSDFAKINPAKKVPTIDDNGFILWESRAIMQYLCNRYQPNSPLYPTDVQKRAVVDRLLSFDTTYFSVIRDALMLKLIRNISPTEFQTISYRNTLKLFETLIGSNKYVAGNDMTIADLTLLASTVSLSINKFQDIQELPNLSAWFNRLQNELPYYQEVNGDVPDMFEKLAKSQKPFYNFELKNGFPISTPPGKG